MRYLLVALLVLGLVMGCSEKKQSGTKIEVKPPEIKVPDTSKTTADAAEKAKATTEDAAKKIQEATK